MPANQVAADGVVVAVSSDTSHRFTKPVRTKIELVGGLGVRGDAHFGETVKHVFLVKRDPTMPNLRQVHLMHAELFEELAGLGFAVAPGELGENITTRGVDLLGLPLGTRLHLGDAAVVEITGLRTPCKQFDAFQSGLTRAMIGRHADGSPAFKAGIMGVVIRGGAVAADDAIRVERPAEPWTRLPAV